MKTYQVRIRKISGQWIVSLLNVGPKYYADSHEQALLFKERFDAKLIEKGASVHNCRKEGREAFNEVKRGLMQ